MKNAKNLLWQLKALPYFNKSTVCQLGEKIGIGANTIDTYISRFMHRRDIFQLKKGLYITSEYFNKNKNDTSYSFYLANVLRTPSYVSSWAALQYYNLATEAIYSVTSVTPKITRNYQTKAGNFTYQSIKKELFTNFSLVKGRFDFFIASPSKALFDLLYFRTHQFRSLMPGLRNKSNISYETVKELAENLRIDIEEMDQKDQKEFYSLISKYLNFAKE